MADLPQISLILVTYLEANEPYLRAALQSIDAQTYPKDKMEIILVSSGPYFPTLQNEFQGLKITHLHHPERHHFPEAVNSGVAKASPNSEFYVLLNDDVILTKKALEKLIHPGLKHAIIGPMSNCDTGWKYTWEFYPGMKFPWTHQDAKPVARQYKQDFLKANSVEDLINSESYFPPGVFQSEFICFYCVAIPKHIWQTVGPLDPTFKTGQDDVDYCKRVKKAGMVVATDSSALVWHASGASADLALTQEIRDQNKRYYQAKWNEPAP